jgi:hypothetical protein
MSDGVIGSNLSTFSGFPPSSTSSTGTSAISLTMQASLGHTAGWYRVYRAGVGVALVWYHGGFHPLQLGAELARTPSAPRPAVSPPARSRERFLPEPESPNENHEDALGAALRKDRVSATTTAVAAPFALLDGKRLYQR